MRFWSASVLGFCLAACAGAAPPVVRPQSAAAPTQGPSATSIPGATSPNAVTTGPKELPELAKELEADRVTGTLAIFDSQDGVLGCSDVKKCQTAVTPASTFKIPHSMIALETGVVEGPDSILPWDHQNYWNDNWNQDLKFRDAFRLSCLPCYRAIARKVGEPREREWLNKLAYGNRETSGGADSFWMDGGLRISPLEQIDFLRRFDGNKLPISDSTADIVRDIMTLDVTEKYVLRGKTGTTGTPEESRMLAWLVGWLEAGERRVFFALLIDGMAPGVDPMQVRRPLIERVLRAKGVM
jgi:beta-lactamase class D